MKIQTKDFGEVEIKPEDIIEFWLPIYGFEHLKKFVFLFEEENQHIAWLQSLEEPETRFILIDPAVVDSGYLPKLPENIMVKLGEGEVFIWLVAVIAEDFSKSTVNMKSPIVVNPQTGRGVQIILDGSYPIRHPLMAGREA